QLQRILAPVVRLRHRRQLALAPEPLDRPADAVVGPPERLRDDLSRVALLDHRDDEGQVVLVVALAAMPGAGKSRCLGLLLELDHRPPLSLGRVAVPVLVAPLRHREAAVAVGVRDRAVAVTGQDAGRADDPVRRPAVDRVAVDPEELRELDARQVGDQLARLRVGDAADDHAVLAPGIVHPADPLGDGAHWSFPSRSLYSSCSCRAARRSAAGKFAVRSSAPVMAMARLRPRTRTVWSEALILTLTDTSIFASC